MSRNCQGNEGGGSVVGRWDIMHKVISAGGKQGQEWYKMRLKKGKASSK